MVETVPTAATTPMAETHQEPHGELEATTAAAPLPTRMVATPVPPALATTVDATAPMAQTVTEVSSNPSSTANVPMDSSLNSNNTANSAHSSMASSSSTVNSNMVNSSSMANTINMATKDLFLDRRPKRTFPKSVNKSVMSDKSPSNLPVMLSVLFRKRTRALDEPWCNWASSQVRKRQPLPSLAFQTETEPDPN